MFLETQTPGKTETKADPFKPESLLAWLDTKDPSVERQRTLFAMLPSTNATDRLKEAMLQRAYNLLWDGDALGADALAEFLPAKDVDAMFAAWSNDQENTTPLSRFYEDRL